MVGIEQHRARFFRHKQVQGLLFFLVQRKIFDVRFFFSFDPNGDREGELEQRPCLFLQDVQAHPIFPGELFINRVGQLQLRGAFEFGPLPEKRFEAFADGTFKMSAQFAEPGAAESLSQIKIGEGMQESLVAHLQPQHLKDHDHFPVADGL